MARKAQTVKDTATAQSTLAFIQARIAERQAQGLRLVVRDSKGNEHTLYPKDRATLAKWTQGFERKGYTICAAS